MATRGEFSFALRAALIAKTRFLFMSSRSFARRDILAIVRLLLPACNEHVDEYSALAPKKYNWHEKPVLIPAPCTLSKYKIQHENKDLYQQDYADSTVTESKSSTRSMSISRTAELYSPGPETTTRQGWGMRR